MFLVDFTAIHIIYFNKKLKYKHVGERRDKSDCIVWIFQGDCISMANFMQIHPKFRYLAMKQKSQLAGGTKAFGSQ